MSAHNTQSPAELTADEASRVWTYDAQTGEFTWRINVRKRKSGDKAGTFAHGYWRIGYKGKIYLAHRLAWLMTTGQWPDGFLDHINQNPSDNRIANLRVVDHRANMMNCRLHVANKSGYRGVFFRDGKWIARQRLGARRIVIGRFDTPEAAAKAIDSAGGHQ